MLRQLRQGIEDNKENFYRLSFPRTITEKIVSFAFVDFVFNAVLSCFATTISSCWWRLAKWRWNFLIKISREVTHCWQNCRNGAEFSSLMHENMWRFEKKSSAPQRVILETCFELSSWKKRVDDNIYGGWKINIFMEMKILSPGQCSVKTENIISFIPLCRLLFSVNIIFCIKIHFSDL